MEGMSRRQGSYVQQNLSWAIDMLLPLPRLKSMRDTAIALQRERA